MLNTEWSDAVGSFKVLFGVALSGTVMISVEPKCAYVSPARKFSFAFVSVTCWTLLM